MALLIYCPLNCLSDQPLRLHQIQSAIKPECSAKCLYICTAQKMLRYLYSKNHFCFFKY
uniref:Uncharacterized protein n=1 Tax=Arundo donax TaxID=35708 RepID=A0A0A9B0Y5_ARUDO